GWQGPVFNIAAISKVGTSALSTAIMEYIEDRREQESHDPDAARAELEVQHRMQQEARERIEALRLQRSRGEVPEGQEDDWDDDWDEDDDSDVEVVYQP